MIFELIQVHDAKKPGDFRLMRKVDFDPSRDKLFSEPLKVKAEPAKQPDEPTPKRSTRKRASKG